MTRRALGPALLLPVLAVAPVRGQAADPILRRAADSYRQLHSLTAEFDQVIIHPMLGTFTSRGTLAQAGTSRLAMRFTDPAGEAIVIDGTFIWIYTPSTAPGQALRAPIESAPGFGVNLLAWLLDRPAERYRASLLRDDQVAGEPVDVLRLTPAVEGLPFTSATLWLARTDALPRRIEVTEPSGNHRTLTLSHLRTDALLPAGTFSFTPPPGVKVIDR